MTDNAVAEFIAALKESLKVRTDEQLATELGVGKSTIASWRRRGIPKIWQVDISLDYGVQFWRYDKSPAQNEKTCSLLLDAAVFLAILRLGQHVSAPDQVRMAAWLTEETPKVRALVMDGLNMDEILGNDPEIYLRLFKEVEAGARATPTQIIELLSREVHPPIIHDRFLT